MVATTPILMTIKQVSALTGFARHTLLRLAQRGTFPRPLYPAPRMPRWRTDEITEWLERLTVERAAD